MITLQDINICKTIELWIEIGHFWVFMWVEFTSLSYFWATELVVLDLHLHNHHSYISKREKYIQMNG